jgi:nucleoid-associated protein YgaU
MRVILEAGKVRRKAGAEPETPAETVDAAATRRVAVRTPAAPVKASEVAARSVPAAAAVATTTALSAPSDEPAQPTEKAPATRSLASAPVALVADDSKPLEAPERLPASAVPAVPTAGLASALALPEVLLRPRLVEMVEPVVPQRVLDEIGKAVEVTADVTIRSDGSVAGVVVLQPAPRTLIRYVVAAIERWRFEPLPGERVHRVQLVFNER